MIQVRNTVWWSCCHGEERTLELSIGGGREQGVGPNLDVAYKCTHVICWGAGMGQPRGRESHAFGSWQSTGLQRLGAGHEWGHQISLGTHSLTAGTTQDTVDCLQILWIRNKNADKSPTISVVCAVYMCVGVGRGQTLLGLFWKVYSYFVAAARGDMAPVEMGW